MDAIHTLTVVIPSTTKSKARILGNTDNVGWFKIAAFGWV